MTIKSHPAPENLLSCAAGSMPEALAAVMACHMSMCPHCRKELSFLDNVGATLLESLPPQPVTSDVASPKVDGPMARRHPAAASASDVPEPLQNVIGLRLEEIKWRRVAPGIWQYPIPLSEHSTASLKLIKVAPGTAIPHHRHSGSEMTLVLKGAFTDEFGRYEVGDVVELDESVQHTPVASPEGDCICLIASEGPPQFHSLIARVFQKFFGF
jgi:putative transcriptional regulator